MVPTFLYRLNLSSDLRAVWITLARNDRPQPFWSAMMTSLILHKLTPKVKKIFGWWFKLTG